MAHELRRPLTVVRGLSDLLLNGSYGKLDAEQGKQVHLISEAAARLSGLIESIASQAWAPGDRRPIYFRNLIRQAVDFAAG